LPPRWFPSASPAPDVLSAAGGGGGHIAVAVFLGIVFAGMGGLTAVTAMHGAGKPHED